MSISKPHKVNPIQFTYEIIISKGKGQLTRKAETMIIDLGNNAMNKSIYHGYDQDDRMDMLQTGLYNMLNNFHNFNPDKTTNAFSYFTEIMKRGTNEAYNLIYSKKGLKKEEAENLRFFSINRINSGDGMFNM
jgi:hypothetical protein